MEYVAVLLLALAIDLAVGEPPASIHPVVWMGRWIGLWSQDAGRGSRGGQLLKGGLLVGSGIAIFVGLALALVAALQQWSPLGNVLLGALLLKSTFSLRELGEAAFRVVGALAGGEIEQARWLLRSLVSRDPWDLDSHEIVAATVESVAENANDSLVAPLFYFVLLGIPGAVAYRFINTCDAMVGYHGKFEYLGKIAARLDDLANWAPARLTGLLLVAAAAIARRDAAAAWRTMWRDHARTASPNAGWPMSAMAGALGVQLTKRGEYALGVARRPLERARVEEAVQLLQAVAHLAVVLSVLALVATRVVGWP